MKSVFLLQHEYERRDGCDPSKMIGVYSSREKAEIVLAKLIQKPGFKNYPDGLVIDEYKLGKDNWVEGFFIWPEPPEEQLIDNSLLPSINK